MEIWRFFQNDKGQFVCFIPNKWQISRSQHTAHGAQFMAYICIVNMHVYVLIQIKSSEDTRETRSHSNRHHALFNAFNAKVIKITFGNMTVSKIKSKFMQQIMLFRLSAFFCANRSASYNSYHHSLHCECVETPSNRCCRCCSRSRLYSYSHWIAYVLWIRMANTNFGKPLAFKVDEIIKCGLSK